MKMAMHTRYTTCAQRVHRFGASALMALALAGCAVDSVPTGDAAIPFRNPTAPIGVTSRYDDARFAGVWFVRAVVDRGSSLVQVERRTDASGDVAWVLFLEACPTGGGQCPVIEDAWAARTDVPGADVITDPRNGSTQRPVVVWVDADYRTAAVGDEGGAFAWVLDRAPRGGADRIKAARQVLEFSGFDLRQMRVGPPWP